ncbi:hypothetical protein, partial [Streptomyces mirabilis]|uniref:hypothetical protein n=1 Tax=Streptomyces mirabilis TaxID=68239 RepID=UPI00367D53E3
PRRDGSAPGWVRAGMGPRRDGSAPGWVRAGMGPAEDTRAEAASDGTGRAGACGVERAATAARTIRALSPRRRDPRVARACGATRVRRAARAREAHTLA